MIEISENSWLEPGLRPGEVLVRDGVGKLVLCWTVWTLGQHHHCSRSLPKDLKQMSRAAFERMRRTCIGRGFGTEAGMSTSSSGDIGGIRAVLRSGWLDRFVDQEQPLNLASMASKAAIELSRMVEANGNGLGQLFASTLIRATWEDVNDLKWGKPGNINRIEKRADGGWYLVDFKGHAPLARLLWGSKGSIERTTAEDFGGGYSLTKFLQNPKSSPAASPVPWALLLRWGRILAFGPLTEGGAYPAHIAAQGGTQLAVEPTVWNTFCGGDATDPCLGSDLETFANALQALLDTPFTRLDSASVDNANKVRVSCPRRSKPSGGKRVVGEGLPGSPAGTPPNSWSRVILNGFTPDTQDGIRMRIETGETGRLSLEEIAYSLADDGHGSGDRVCLKALDVVWDWQQSRLVAFVNEWSDPARRRDRLQADNVEVNIAGFFPDIALLRLRIEPVDRDTAFSPADEIAILRLLMPEASITPESAIRHVFRIEARKSDLCLAHRDAIDGKFKQIVRDPDTLYSQAEILDQALLTLYVEIREGFPNDNRMTRELGRREAEGVRAREDAL